MLIHTFLQQYIAPGLTVRIFDLDAVSGNNLKEGEAAEMMAAHRFDYNSEVIDFYIYHDNVTIYIKRQ